MLACGLVAAVLIAVPVWLIKRQPDLGTAALVGAAGFYVIFFAGLSWKVLGTLFGLGLAALPIAWGFLHGYQRRRVLTPNGVCVLAGMGSAGKHEGQWSRLGGNLKSFFVSPFISQKFKFFIAKVLQADLTVLRDLMQEGKVKPVIDREYPMTETAEALRYLEEGHARGKIVITIE